MATNKNYYQEKQIKLAQKLQKIKDTYIVDSLNSAQRLANEIAEIQNETKEINDLLKDEEVRIKINKK